MTYNRNLALNYMENYTYNPNKDLYPYYEKDDCANFISQVLYAGGMAEIGSRWDSFDSWFCNTNKVTDLKNVAITWRAARYFRKHWGNENGVGLNRARKFYEITVSQALENFINIYNLLQTGDVIQYGSPKNQNLPYHTQAVYEKGYNNTFGINDLFMAQHTTNINGISLYDYLGKLPYKELRMVYIYIIE